MTRREFGKLFAGAMVGLGLKGVPVATIFPEGVPWPTQEQESLAFVNQASSKIWPAYQFLLKSFPEPGDLISPYDLETEAWLREQEHKFRSKELS